MSGDSVPGRRRRAEQRRDQQLQNQRDEELREAVRLQHATRILRKPLVLDAAINAASDSDSSGSDPAMPQLEEVATQPHDALPEARRRDILLELPRYAVVAEYTKQIFGSTYPGYTFFKHAQYWAAEKHNVALHWHSHVRSVSASSKEHTFQEVEKRQCRQNREWYTLAQTFEFVYNQGGDMTFAMRMWNQMTLSGSSHVGRPFALWPSRSSTSSSRSSRDGTGQVEASPGGVDV